MHVAPAGGQRDQQPGGAGVPTRDGGRLGHGAEAVGHHRVVRSGRPGHRRVERPDATGHDRVAVVGRVVADHRDPVVVVRPAPQRREDGPDVLLDLRGQCPEVRAGAPVGVRLLAQEQVVGADGEADQPGPRVRLQVGHRVVELGAGVGDVQRERRAVADRDGAARGDEGVLAAVALGGGVDHARGRLAGAGGVREADPPAGGEDLGVADEVRRVPVVGADRGRLEAERHRVAQREVPCRPAVPVPVPVPVAVVGGRGRCDQRAAGQRGGSDHGCGDGAPGTAAGGRSHGVSLVWSPPRRYGECDDPHARPRRCQSPRCGRASAPIRGPVDSAGVAGRIRDEDIALVRERARIDDVVSDYVTLKHAGGGSLKGLCPFHDEKSPSFNVTPARGFFHCFGCGEGGDVIAFLMKIDGPAFAEAVERLADKSGIQLRYEEGTDRPAKREHRTAAAAGRGAQGRRGLLRRAARPRRRRQPAREFLTERGFDQDAAEHFGVGFAPRGGDALPKHLRPAGLHGRRAGHRRAGRPGPARSLRPVPGPADVADPGDHRRRDRLRRAAALRRRPDRREVPEHPRDPDLQEVPRPLRHRPGPARDRQAPRRPWSSRATPT